MDIDAFLAALPYRNVYDAVDVRDIPFVTWHGKPSPPYNGFSGVERLHLWQLVRWLEAQQALPPMEQCDICRSNARLQRHSENYYNPLQAAVVCGACHRIVHLRFWRWREWQELCRRHDPAGGKWFSMLEFVQPDVSSYLRTRIGPEVSNLKRSPIFPLPTVFQDALQRLEFQN